MKRAIVNGTMFDVEDGSAKENIKILIENKRIIEVGEHVNIPSDTEVIDASGCYITPGLIHGFTHTGLKEHGIRWEGDDSFEASSTIQPKLSVIDGINPFDKTFEIARACGITTSHVAPSGQNVVGGKTAIIKTTGNVIDDMIVEREHGVAISLGEMPKSSYRDRFKTPLTRMRMAYLIREQLRQALYNEESDVYNEAIYQRILNKEASLYIRAHRADDIMTAIRIKQEFDIRVVLVHGTEAYQVTKELSHANIPVLAGPFYSAKSRDELQNIHPSTIKKIADEDIPYAHVSGATRNLGLEGALSVREGVSLENALYALTLGSAKILGISNQVGSIEAGKSADIVLWNGKPLDFTTNVEQTFIGGTSVYKREGGVK